MHSLVSEQRLVNLQFSDFFFFFICKMEPFPLHSTMVAVAQSCLTLVTPRTVAHQAPLSLGFSRQEY